MQKKADPGIDLDAAHSQLAMEQFKKILLLGAGAGLAARGASGFIHMLHRNSQPATPSSAAANVLPFKVPTRPQREEKIAVLEPYKNTWWAMPLHATGAVGATFGGYKLMDYLLNKQRHKGLQEEVDSAKSDFESALSHQPIGTGKRADDKASKLSQQLDEIFDIWQKQANWPTFGAGTAATVAALTAAIGGHLGYSVAKSQSEANRLDLAEKERQRRRQVSTAPFLVATPEG
jgi:hypothetical protein